MIDPASGWQRCRFVTSCATILSGALVPSMAVAQTTPGITLEQRAAALNRLEELEREIAGIRRTLGVPTRSATGDVPRQQVGVRTLEPIATPPASQAVGVPPPPDAQHSCSLDTETSRRAYFADPRPCEKEALAKADKSLRSDQSGIDRIELAGVLPERHLDRRGINATLSNSSDATHATLKVGVKKFFRKPPSRETEYNQRVSTKNYSFGVRATLDKDDKKKAPIGNLDALKGGLSAFVGYSRSFYPPEKLSTPPVGDADLMQRASDLYSSSEGKAGLSADCAAAQTKDKKINCSGQGLINWIFSRDASGRFANPKAVEAYNAVFWGSPQKAPRWGYGFEIEVGRPTFTYYPFALVTVPDPFKPGSTRQVVDPAELAPGFGDRLVKDDVRTTWSLKSFVFGHVSSSDWRNIGRWLSGTVAPNYYERIDNVFSRNKGTTLIGSLAYKKDYAIKKELRDMEICVTPPEQPLTEICQLANVAAPEKDAGFVVGAELRQLFDTFRVLPTLGIAPRYTYAFSKNRNGLDVPLFLTLDDKGALNGGVKYSREWGGRNADSTDKATESVWSIFLGASLDMNGSN
jgi:hypothetical protein